MKITEIKTLRMEEFSNICYVQIMTDEGICGLGETFFNDAADGIDRVVDSVEPLLAALLTIAVGATLLAVMLPLIGIMGSIG